MLRPYLGLSLLNLAKLILNIIINLHVVYRYNNPAPKSDKSNNLGFFFRKLRF